MNSLFKKLLVLVLVVIAISLVINYLFPVDLNDPSNRSNNNWKDSIPEKTID